MAISTGSTITWADISAVMANINTARQHCGKGTTSISGGVGTPAKRQNVVDLYNALYACNGVTLPAMGGTVFVKSITMPNVGDLIKPLPLTEIQTEAKRIAALNFSGFCTGDFGFSFCSSFFSSNFNFCSTFFSSNFGFCSSFFSSNFGFCSSFFSSDFSFCSTFFSSNFGFCSSFFSSNFTFRSSFFTSNFSFRSSFFTSNFSFNSSFFTSNFTHRSSFFSGNFGFNGSFFTSNFTHRSSFNATFFSSNFTHRSSFFSGDFGFCRCRSFSFRCDATCIFSAPAVNSGFGFGFSGVSCRPIG